MFLQLRNAFITGLVLLLPLGVTYIVVAFLVERVGKPASKVFFQPLREYLPPWEWVEYGLWVLATVAVVMLITGLGFLSRYFIGKFLIRAAERAINAVPVINTVYKTVKQIVDTFSEQQKAVFQQVVLIEYPRKGIFAVGFLTSDGRGEIQDKTDASVVNIFVPTTPNPTSGFLLMVPRGQTVPLKMSISDGMKLIISGGAVVPAYTAGPEQTTPLAVTNPREVPGAPVESPGAGA